ncbi:MAG TPA: hypothetical protein VL463_09575 [Kofleriaceae bacterium]|jgi:hypothetical protein|nr:hypothetical protein [Kofleriaceae bacterium]
MRKLALVLTCVVAVGCSKKEDRDTVCRVAKETFVKGMHDQISQFSAKDPSISNQFQDLLNTAEPKFDAFCHKLDDKDIQCLSDMPGAANDPACAHTMEITKKELFGM